MYRRIGPRRRRPGPDRAGRRRPASTCPARPTRRSSGRSASSCCSSGWSSAGPLLVLGLIALVLALLFWGREALRDYDHVAERRTRSCPAVVHDGPPPGVHMPGPVVPADPRLARGRLLFLGLVFAGWVLAVGVGFTDRRPARLAERRPQGVHADGRRGHDRPPRERARRRGWPKASAVTVFALLSSRGRADRRLAPAALRPSAAPRRLAGRRRARPADPAPRAVRSSGGIALTAQNIAFDVTTLYARRPTSRSRSRFDNKDAGTPPRRRHPRRDAERRSFDGKDFTGRRAEDLRRPGAEGRHVQVRVLDPSRADERAADRRRLSRLDP